MNQRCYDTPFRSKSPQKDRTAARREASRVLLPGSAPGRKIDQRGVKQIDQRGVKHIGTLQAGKTTQASLGVPRGTARPSKEGRAIPTGIPTPTCVLLKAPGREEEEEGREDDDDTNERGEGKCINRTSVCAGLLRFVARVLETTAPTSSDARPIVHLAQQKV